MITKHQLDRALGHIRLLGPDLPDFDRDVKLVSDYIDQVEHQRGEMFTALEKIRDVEPLSPQARNMAELARHTVRSVNQPDTVLRSSGAKEA